MSGQSESADSSRQIVVHSLVPEHHDLDQPDAGMDRAQRIAIDGQRAAVGPQADPLESERGRTCHEHRKLGMGERLRADEHDVGPGAGAPALRYLADARENVIGATVLNDRPGNTARASDGVAITNDDIGE